MQERRSDFDVTNSVNTTEPAAVAAEVRRIYLDLYRKGRADDLEQPFADFAALYQGEHPEYYACDTGYHDIQHVLDVTLAMARLLDGYQRAGREPLGERMFRMGIVLALYHDCGYIRHRKDTRHRNGAEYTLTHVSRGSRFLLGYLPRIGMEDLAPVASRVVHFTGYEMPIEQIKLPDPVFRVVGNLLGSADILGQMADRCYLEKCYDRLFPEFVLGGVARRRNKQGKEEIIFESAADLIAKTPNFYISAAHRLDESLDRAYQYAGHHFGGPNYYVEAVEKNIGYARLIGTKGDMSKLRRHAPNLATVEYSEQHHLI
jgi:hypothetical protein